MGSEMCIRDRGGGRARGGWAAVWRVGGRLAGGRPFRGRAAVWGAGGRFGGGRPFGGSAAVSRVGVKRGRAAKGHVPKAGSCFRWWREGPAPAPTPARGARARACAMSACPAHPARRCRARVRPAPRVTRYVSRADAAPCRQPRRAQPHALARGRMAGMVGSGNPGTRRCAVDRGTAVPRSRGAMRRKARHLQKGTSRGRRAPR